MDGRAKRTDDHRIRAKDWFLTAPVRLFDTFIPHDLATFRPEADTFKRSKKWYQQQSLGKWNCETGNGGVGKGLGADRWGIRTRGTG